MNSKFEKSYIPGYTGTTAVLASPNGYMYTQEGVQPPPPM